MSCLWRLKAYRWSSDGTGAVDGICLTLCVCVCVCFVVNRLPGVLPVGLAHLKEQILAVYSGRK